ncbi:MAG: formyltransferase family protein [Candidatus Pacearchaeota archaeon]
MAEKLIPLYNHPDRVMRVAGLMSGSGSNLRKIIEHELHLNQEVGHSYFHVAVIFSDNSESNAVKIGNDYDIPVLIRDKKAFYKKRGKPLKDMQVRAEFDALTVRTLSTYECPVAAYAGYMSIASPILVNTFLGVNVHPADLSITDESGKRKYIGDHAVLDALVAKEKELRSSTHLITNQVDGGPVLMISAPVNVTHDISAFTGINTALNSLNQVADLYQNKLKEVGDWVVFPRTLEDIAAGRFSKDSNGNLYYGENPIPFGIRPFG